MSELRTQRSDTRPRERAEGSGGATLALATLAFFGGFAGVSTFGPLVPKLVSDLSLGPLAAAALAATPALSGALLRLPFGAAVERRGGRVPFLVLLGLTIAGLGGLIALLAADYPHHMAGTYWLLLFFGALAGCGIATFPVGIAQVSFWLPRHRQGKSLALYAGIGNLSPGLSAILLPIGAAGLGLVGAYGAWLAVVVLITAAYLAFAKDAPWFRIARRGRSPEDASAPFLLPGAPVPAGSARAGFATAARRAATWELTFYYFVSFGGFLALTAWLPSYWHASYATSLREGGLLTAAFSLLGAALRVPGGAAADKMSPRAPLLFNFVLIAAGAAVLAGSHSFVLSLSATMAIGAAMGWQNAIVFKLLPMLLPDAVGAAAGVVGGLGALGGFLIPLAMSKVGASMGQPGALAHGFVVLAALACIGSALSLAAGARERSARAAEAAPAS